MPDTLQFFNSWVLNEPSGVGVSTHSPPIDIATLATSQAVNGTPSLSIPAGSKIQSFDLSSFWFGCALDTVEGLAGKATQCTIDVAGFRKGQEVAVASFTFTPPVTDLSVPQIQAVFSGTFIALENVTIIQDDPVLNVLVADNFKITTHSWVSKGCGSLRVVGRGGSERLVALAQKHTIRARFERIYCP